MNVCFCGDDSGDDGRGRCGICIQFIAELHGNDYVRTMMATCVFESRLKTGWRTSRCSLQAFEWYAVLWILTHLACRGSQLILSIFTWQVLNAQS